MYSIIGVMPKKFRVSSRIRQVGSGAALGAYESFCGRTSEEHAGSGLPDRGPRQGWIACLKPLRMRIGWRGKLRVASGIAVFHSYSGRREDLRESDIEDVRPVLRALLLAVTVVLLIACANVAGLSLVRAIRRRREYAVRLALGAGTGSVLRETIFEGLLLSISGALLGLLFAAAAIRTALALLPDSMPRIDSISIDAGVAGFAFAIALATGLACSLAPGFAALRTNISESLKEGRSSGRGRRPVVALGSCRRGRRSGPASTSSGRFAQLPKNACGRFPAFAPTTWWSPVFNSHSSSTRPRHPQIVQSVGCRETYRQARRSRGGYCERRAGSPGVCQSRLHG